MSDRTLTCLLLGVLFAGAPAPLLAQSADGMDGHPMEQRLAAGGEISGVAGPEDHLAFFNYTDYHRNALRIARARLFGEWRFAQGLSIVGELRTENTDGLMLPVLYLRWRPLGSHTFTIQAGRIPPVIGAFSHRAYSRDNAVIGTPLAYQYLTSLRSDALPRTIDDLLKMRGRGWQSSFPIGVAAPEPGVSLLSVSHFDTGVEGLWQHQRLDLSAAVSRGSPAVPVVHETNHGLMWSGRAVGHLPAGVTVGVSAARGQWLTDNVLALTPGGTKQPSSQSIIGADVEFGTGPWLFRSEWLRSVFDVPIAAAAPPDVRLAAWSGYGEARYRFFARWQIGTRIENLGFSSLRGTLFDGAATSWDAPVRRVESTLGFRVTRRFEVRGGWQENWRTAGRVHEQGFPILAAMYWF